jgi:hypothetical protein
MLPITQRQTQPNTDGSHWSLVDISMAAVIDARGDVCSFIQCVCVFRVSISLCVHVSCYYVEVNRRVS